MRTISTLTIVKDEQVWIKHMLDFIFEYVKPDEVIIVDGGSTDDTVGVINSYIGNGVPIKLIENQMPDSFTEQRNIALKNCSCSWVLQIDADETYSKNIKGLIQDIKFGKYEQYDGFIFPTAHLMKDDSHMINGGGDIHLRLFKNKAGFVYEGEIHEKINLTDKTLQVGKIALRHYSMLKSDAELLDKGKRYLNWTAQSSKAGIPIGHKEFFIEAKNNYDGPLFKVPEEWM